MPSPEPTDGRAVAGADEPASVVASLRAFLKDETVRLKARQRAGLGGHEIASARSALVDQVVTRACREAAERADPSARRQLLHCAVVALGGYGRRELSPGSDVDVLFLHGDSTSTLASFVERTLITLWDTGLMVGHSFRSVRDCVSAAREDLHSHTAMSEARLVTGNQALFEALQLRLDKTIRASRTARAAFVVQMREQWADRLAHHGGAVCALEPQVKEGPGGLRDLHSVLWVASALFGVHGIARLDAPGLLAAADHAAARQAYDFLLRVRNEAHFVTGRKTDLLTLDLQGELARQLGYRDRGSLLASERLMRDYYRHAFRLHEICKEFVESQVETRPPRLRLLGSLRLPRRRRRALEEKDGVLQPRKGWAPRSGGGLLDAVERCQSTGVPVSRTLKRTLRRHATLAGGKYRRSHEAGAALLKLAARRGRVGAAFRLMHETGVLGRLVPEWSRITFLVQHDFFHKYTVDEHTLRAIDALDGLTHGDDPLVAPLARLLDEVTDARPLYLGMWLHDIAKGRGGGHVPKGVVLARRILARLGVDADVADDVVFLVGAHLEMSQTSQQRDLSEPGLIAAFAARVGSLSRLNLLLLLTYADHEGVGPGTWNAWKASLLWELYERTRDVLASPRGGTNPDPSASERDRAAAELLRYFPQDEVAHHFALLPERYLRATDAARLASHFRLIRSRGSRAAAFEWSDRGDGHGTDLTVTAEDRPGLLSLLTGTLSVHGIDILGADVFARNDGLVLDTLRVAERPGQRALRPERRVRLEAVLLDAVSGGLDVPAAFERWRAQDRRTRRPGGRAARHPSVRFDQDASALATVVAVKAPDQPGLAYMLTHALAEQRLDITSARIATAKALALDVFYVRDAEGRKLDADAMARVEAALLAALGGSGENRWEA